MIVHTAEQVTVGPADPVENAFYNAIESCAFNDPTPLQTDC